MRKQTKLVAVLSAAALLAMGASMTSFAAGWQKDDAGVWHYYDSDDEMVTGEWKKDGGKWFYLDEDGDMAVDQWVDDDYYVAEDGHMLVNEWKKTMADEDVSEPDDEGEHWYYFDNKGKKVTSDKKKINGRTYYFNSDGEMRDGWYEDGTDIYYLGGEDEGWRTEGQWLWLERPTDDEDLDEGEWADDENCSLDCDDEGWYWFGNDGKMFKDSSKKKKINGKYYYFNKHGQMLYEWINTKAEDGNTTDGVATAADTQASASEVVDGMRYANQVEEGWRADGWYEIDGSDDAKTSDDTDWYYFKNGEAKKADMNDIVVGAKDDNDNVYRTKEKINGKYFAFNEVGQMQTGLQFIDGSLYYFDNDGYMKTGKVSSVEEEDGDTYTYYFTTKNGKNGTGVTGEKDGYLYWNGKKLEADDDYRFYVVKGDVYLVNTKGKIQKSDKKYDIEEIGDDVYVTFSGKTVSKYAINGKREDVVSLNKQNMVKAGDISVPSIWVYDNVLAPTDVVNGQGNHFYRNDDATGTDGLTEKINALEDAE